MLIFEKKLKVIELVEESGRDEQAAAWAATDAHQRVLPMQDEVRARTKAAKQARVADRERRETERQIASFAQVSVGPFRIGRELGQTRVFLGNILSQSQTSNQHIEPK